jgi:hypothetical protein
MGGEIEIKEGAELGREVQEILVRILYCDGNVLPKKCENCPLNKEVEVTMETKDLVANLETFGRVKISKLACSKSACEFLREIVRQIQ